MAEIQKYDRTLVEFPHDYTESYCFRSMKPLLVSVLVPLVIYWDRGFHMEFWMLRMARYHVSTIIIATSLCAASYILYYYHTKRKSAKETDFLVSNKTKSDAISSSSSSSPPPPVCLEKTVEICVSDISSAQQAWLGGANSLELCSNRSEGGVTPSIGLIEECLARYCVPGLFQIHVLIRPRPGDFCYSSEEFEVMVRDASMARAMGVSGIVVGILDRQGRVHKVQ